MTSKKKKNIIIVGILFFVIMVVGISYGLFVYNKDVADISLTTGAISIDLSNINGSINLSNVIPKTDNEGINSTDYIDFTVSSTVDSEKIYYEVYILPSTNNTLNTAYLKTYLTDQTNNVIENITLYDNLPNSTIEGGKAIYRGLTELNNDYSSRNETKNFRLRLWLDNEYHELTSKTFSFNLYLYAKNVEENYVIPSNAVSGDLSITLGDNNSEFDRRATFNIYKIAEGNYGDWTVIEDYLAYGNDIINPSSWSNSQLIRNIGNVINERMIPPNYTDSTGTDGELTLEDLPFGIYYIAAVSTVEQNLRVKPKIISIPGSLNGSTDVSVDIDYVYEEEEEPPPP